MLDLRRLRLLRELAHRGTIAAVAEALSFTPSAVSQQLAALERETGRRLLTRTGRRVELTEAGAVLAAHTETVLAALAQAEAALAAASDGLSATVRLGAFPTALRSIVLPALRGIDSSATGLRVTVTEVDPADAPDRLRGERLDLALVHEYDNVPSSVGAGIDLEPLLDELVYLATGDRAPTTIGDHADSPWILGNPDTLCHTMTVRTCQSHGFDPRVAHHIDDFATVAALVAAGAGVALIPHLAATDLPTAVRLTPLPLRRRTHIATRRGTRDHPALATVRHHLHPPARDILGADLPTVPPGPRTESESRADAPLPNASAAHGGTD